MTKVFETRARSIAPVSHGEKHPIGNSISVLHSEQLDGRCLCDCSRMSVKPKRHQQSTPRNKMKTKQTVAISLIAFLQLCALCTCAASDESSDLNLVRCSYDSSNSGLACDCEHRDEVIFGGANQPSIGGDESPLICVVCLRDVCSIIPKHFFRLTAKY